MTSIESRKAEFQAWIAAHVGVDLFTSQIVDAAAEIFSRHSFSVAISRVDIPDQEIHGITVAGDRKRLLGLQARVEKVMADELGGRWKRSQRKYRAYRRRYRRG